MGELWKRWIDSVSYCFKKSLNIGQARRMVHDRSVWWEFVKGNAWGIAHEINGYMKP